MKEESQVLEKLVKALERYQALYKSKQRLLLAEVDRHAEAAHQAQLEATWAWLHAPEPERAQLEVAHEAALAHSGAWHQVWCLISGASVVLSRGVSPDVWAQFEARLGEYEAGVIVNGALQPREQT